MNPVEKKVGDKTVSIYDKFEEHISRRQSSGALGNFLFSFEDVSEYKPEPTQFNNSSSTTTTSTPTPAAPTIKADDLPF